MANLVAPPKVVDTYCWSRHKDALNNLYIVNKRLDFVTKSRGLEGLEQNFSEAIFQPILIFNWFRNRLPDFDFDWTDFDFFLLKSKMGGPFESEKFSPIFLLWSF